jgi:hypothetical protein
MAAWIGRVKALWFKLDDIGVALSAEDVILALTEGLDKSYEAFIISLDGSDPMTLTQEYVENRMLNEESRRQVRHDQLEDGVKVKQEMAMMATPLKDLECWKCGKKGHKKGQCPDNEAEGKDSKGKGPAAVSNMVVANWSSVDRKPGELYEGPLMVDERVL